MRTVEHRRRHRHATLQVIRQREDLIVGQRLQIDALAEHFLVVVVDLVEELAQFRNLFVRLDHALDLFARSLRGPAQMRLQDLADVHTRRHAERIQHDVDRLAVRHVRHVLDRNDHRHDALVAVAAGHLVARLDAALDGEVYLYHFQHARGEVVAGGDLGLLVLEALVELGLVLGDLGLRAFQQLRGFLVLHAQREPLVLLSGCRGIRLVSVVPFFSRPDRRSRPRRSAARAGAGRSRLRECGTGRRSPS